ncbi:type II toxin-antitoxin system RelE/ParE family toxin [Paraburkholderia sp. BR10882]|uniref:type II toxin-antitoxin system RelE/ParE family toxin n=1 Tax=unclassified Paraburkholderia TaxID=2615204 RepID=UPI0034CD0E8B
MIVEWLPRAVEQLLSIIDYVSEDSPAAAVALGQAIREKTTMLATYPNRYRTGRVRGTREMVVIPTYIVVYRVAGERVQILRVRHARQRR